jgi:hypothetical protein
MSPRPRIVTDDRVACVIFAGQIGEPLSDRMIVELLSSRLERVLNVYNCPAFALARSCRSVLALARPAELDLAFFLSEPIELRADCDLFGLRDEVLSATDLLNKLIKESGQECDFRFEKFWIECTGRRES